MLLGLVCLSLGIISTGPAQAATLASGESTGTSTMSMTTGVFESRLLSHTNYRRARHGCRPIRLNSALVLAARRHSNAMSNQSTLSHRLAGVGDLASRVVAAGYTHWRMLAENLAWGQATPREVFRDWVHSPGHRANLDNCRLREIGFGVVYRSGRPWVTADFGRRF